MGGIAWFENFSLPINAGGRIVNEMVNYSPNSLDSVFGALSDPTRRHILELLAKAECRVTDLASRFSISLPAISRHLRVLEEAGLIARQRDGRIHRMRLEAQRMKEASAWIEQYRRFWEDQLSSLATYLEQHPEQKPEEPKTTPPTETTP